LLSCFNRENTDFFAINSANNGQIEASPAALQSRRVYPECIGLLSFLLTVTEGRPFLPVAAFLPLKTLL
jgi:hypothetical protein